MTFETSSSWDLKISRDCTGMKFSGLRLFGKIAYFQYFEILIFRDNACPPRRQCKWLTLWRPRTHDMRISLSCIYHDMYISDIDILINVITRVMAMYHITIRYKFYIRIRDCVRLVIIISDMSTAYALVSVTSLTMLSEPRSSFNRSYATLIVFLTAGTLKLTWIIIFTIFINYIHYSSFALLSEVVSSSVYHVIMH